MSAWIDRILAEFTADLFRMWIAADPDDVLLDERVQAGLRERGFELMPFDDSVVFRAEYEERYRDAWDRGHEGPAKALIVHLRGTNTDDLPWDYLRQARRVSVSLADLFPNLSHSVVRQVGSEHYEQLFEAQANFATQPLGETQSKEFVLTHIFRISPHLISRPEDLWRELLRLHYRDAALPAVLGNHVAQVLGTIPAFKALPLRDLFCSKVVLLRVVQDAWFRYLTARGIVGSRTGEPPAPEFSGHVEIPFDHPDVRVIVDSMFLDGLLHPLSAQGVIPNLPDWAKVGVVADPLALRRLVEEGLSGLEKAAQGADATHRDWIALARKLGELLARYHLLDTSRAEGLKDKVARVQALLDERLLEWIRAHYSILPSLPVAKGPVMVHHIPRYLALRREQGEEKVALVVFDGMAFDQWVQIREILAKRAPELTFEEAGCFAWIPTLTAVSRQAIFSGLRPREFADSIDGTGAEKGRWISFWQEARVLGGDVLYRKSIRSVDDLPDLAGALDSSAAKVAGLVVDTIDEFVHGAVLGKRGIAAQIENWCDSGFVERLFASLTSKGFSVYVTSDHGNVDAVGQGRPNQGVAAELRGERVRAYRSEVLAAEASSGGSGRFRVESAGLPSEFLPVFAGGRTAFLNAGDRAVVHGGLAIEELIVPFVRIASTRKRT